MAKAKKSTSTRPEPKFWAHYITPEEIAALAAGEMQYLTDEAHGRDLLILVPPQAVADYRAMFLGRVDVAVERTPMVRSLED